MTITPVVFATIGCVHPISFVGEAPLWIAVCEIFLRLIFIRVFHLTMKDAGEGRRKAYTVLGMGRRVGFAGVIPSPKV
jgi:hypothetical protein